MTAIDALVARDLAGCTACGHVHLTYGVLWHDDDTVTLLCHEDDHSCYEQFTQAVPPPSPLLETS